MKIKIILLSLLASISMYAKAMDVTFTTTLTHWAGSQETNKNTFRVVPQEKSLKDFFLSPSSSEHTIKAKEGDKFDVYMFIDKKKTYEFKYTVIVPKALYHAVYLKNTEYVTDNWDL